jgi:hypothetical protein
MYNWPVVSTPEAPKETEKQFFEHLKKHTREYAICEICHGPSGSHGDISHG